MSKKTEALEVILGLMPNAKFIDKNGKDVTEDVKKSYNVANNIAQAKVQDLTELWEKRKLPNGLYYVGNTNKSDFAYCKNQSFYTMESNIPNILSKGIDVLSEVPTYEEWQAKDSQIDFLQQKISVLESKATKYDNIKVNGNYPDKISKLKSRIKGLTEENESLKELLDSMQDTNKLLAHKLQPFTDPYFRGLTTKDIAELAKKSIRLTTQHCKDTTTIFNLKELLCCCADELEAIEDKDIEIERLLEEIEKELK